MTPGEALWLGVKVYAACCAILVTGVLVDHAADRIVRWVERRRDPMVQWRHDRDARIRAIRRAGF